MKAILMAQEAAKLARDYPSLTTQQAIKLLKEGKNETN
jgi:hypothetical protein